jgi:hypothetical protein
MGIVFLCPEEISQCYVVDHQTQTSAKIKYEWSCSLLPPPESQHELDTNNFAFHDQVLGAFAKLRIAPISFVMSALPHVTTGLPLVGYS